MPSLEFSRHPRRLTRWGLFRVARWVSRDRRYAIEQSRYVGVAGSLPTVFYALLLEGKRTEMLGRHRTRRAAERTILSHWRES